MNIGQAIKEIRKQKGLSQGELSKIAKVNQGYLSGVETGTRQTVLPGLRKIAEGLNIPLPILMYLSLEESDIEESKQGIYATISPVIEAMIKELI